MFSKYDFLIESAAYYTGYMIKNNTPKEMLITRDDLVLSFKLVLYLKEKSLYYFLFVLLCVHIFGVLKKITFSAQFEESWRCFRSACSYTRFPDYKLPDNLTLISFR